MGAKHEVAAWAVRLGRLGLAARGVVYLMIGYLAAAAAAGRGGRLADREGAVSALGSLPYGELILWAVAIGLIGYVAWRFAQAILDLDRNGSDAKGLRKRAAALCSGLAYTGLSAAAIAGATGKPGSAAGRGGGDASAQDWTAWLMSQPFGQWLVAIAGAIVGLVALYQFNQAISCKFARRLRGGELTDRQESWIRRAGRAGYAARGVAFALIAWFLINAALHANPGEAGGLEQALRALSEQPHGTWLVGIVGVGLALFGAYSLVEARYRRIG